MHRLIAIPALLLVAAQSPAAPFVVEQTGEGFATIDEAVGSIRDGEGTILIAPGVYRQCTVQQGGRITFRAIEPGKVIFEATPCEDKAMFVLRGRGSVVDGLVFRNVRVGDGNGAGIRTEMGDLTVTNSTFLDMQEGILGGQPTGQRITIDRSTFTRLGQCHESESCAHAIYLANQGAVTVTRSRFEQGRGGHYVKVRSPKVTITGSSFDDSKGTRTNYAIDLPEGATGLIAGNAFVQGPGKENGTTIIAIAAEAKTYPSTGLRIENNEARLAPGADSRPAFVGDWSGDRLAIGANRLSAGITPYARR